mmetsp:Transcript_10003/g.26807  ORF Transcript_10003/g.26807 Transcript_10003/m.26807 type:complete len:265 (-) Transcript_10003:312-1106(-)
MNVALLSLRNCVRHRHGDGNGHRLLRDAHSQHAKRTRRGDAASFGILRHRKRPLVRSARFSASTSLHTKHIIVDGDLNVLRSHAGHVLAQHVRLVVVVVVVVVAVVVVVVVVNVRGHRHCHGCRFGHLASSHVQLPVHNRGAQRRGVGIVRKLQAPVEDCALAVRGLDLHVEASVVVLGDLGGVCVRTRYADSRRVLVLVILRLKFGVVLHHHCREQVARVVPTKGITTATASGGYRERSAGVLRHCCKERRHCEHHGSVKSKE